MAESFFAAIKRELIDTRAWPTLEGLRRAVFKTLKHEQRFARHNIEDSGPTGSAYRRYWSALNSSSEVPAEAQRTSSPRATSDSTTAS